MLIHLAQSYWMKPGGAQSVLSPTQRENIFLPLRPVEGTGLESVTPPPPYLSLPELIGGRGGREKGWLTISFSFPLLSFLPLTYSICSWSSAPAVLAVLCSDLPSLVTSQFLQSRCRMLRFELTPLLWVNCDSFWGWTSFWKQREVRHVQWCWDNKLTCGELM